jgi:hypothetical protein
VESVDELEPERDQERDEQQQEWQIRRRLHPGVFDVYVQAVGHVEDAGGQDPEEQNQGEGIRGRLENRFLAGEMGGTVQRGGDIGHGILGVGARGAKTPPSATRVTVRTPSARRQCYWNLTCV